MDRPMGAGRFAPLGNMASQSRELKKKSDEFDAPADPHPGILRSIRTFVGQLVLPFSERLGLAGDKSSRFKKCLRSLEHPSNKSRSR